MELFKMAIGLLLINNVVLSKFLGICPFLGVSKKSKDAFGMGVAVIFVIFFSSLITYGLYHLVLLPLGIEYLQLITFILVIAAFVQFVEMFIKKTIPNLYKSLGIYLPLITTNCVVLFAAKDNITQKYDLIQTMVNSFFIPFGFMIMIYLFSTIRERLEISNTPKAFKGNPIALIVLALMALAMSGLNGLI